MRETVTLLPRLLVLPPTLMWSTRNFSKAAASKMPSATGCVQLTVKVWFSFLAFLAGALPAAALVFFAGAAATATFFGAAT